MSENKYNQNYKLISLEEFKKLDINTISYVQLYTGEILMIDHPYLHNTQQSKPDNQGKDKEDINQNENQKEISESKPNKKKRKRKKNNNKNKKEESNSLLKDSNTKEKPNSDYFNDNYENEKNIDNGINDQNNLNKNNKKESKITLPNEYYSPNNKIYRAYSVEVKNKGIILFNQEWKDIQDYDIKERMEFYDSIPNRAKFWERESYDPTRSLFQSKRLSKTYNYNQQQNIVNYKPISQESYSSPSEDEKEKYSDEQINYEYNNNNYDYPLNQLVSSQKDLYDLAFGPIFSQYMINQLNNNQWGEYKEDYWQNHDEFNYYQESQYNYGDYNQNNYDYYNSNYYNYEENKFKDKKIRKKKKVQNNK